MSLSKDIYVYRVVSFVPLFIKIGESEIENFSCTSAGNYGTRKDDMSVTG